MTNHVHLLLPPPSAEAVSRFIMALGKRYVQYINKTYRRTGTLWDSRYKSSLIQADEYLLACQRYIELNPVRAGMVDEPAHYRWGSYRSNALGQTDTLLTPHPLYLSLGAKQRSGERPITAHCSPARLMSYRSLTSEWRCNSRNPLGTVALPIRSNA